MPSGAYTERTMGLTTEIRQGLAATAPFLLSHHVPPEHDRCYAPVVLGRRVYLCARCSGVYPGIVAGVVVPTVGPGVPWTALLVALFPLPALLDWTLTAFTDRRGTNGVRTLTGVLLGFGYGLGLTALVSGPRVVVLVIGAIYAVATGVLVSLSETVG